ncbi:MAG: hypothetical protein J7497_14120 [Chitinophagaceae bacterium]|nr:hypothetical protein [Chitinophagaceae bacterium]
MLTPEAKIYLPGILSRHHGGIMQLLKDLIEVKFSDDSTVVWSGVEHSAEEIVEAIDEMLDLAGCIVDEEKEDAQ